MFNKNFADDGIRTVDVWCGSDCFANWATTTADVTNGYILCRLNEQNIYVA